MIYGQDIEQDITSHELARLLLAGPDRPVRIPDELNDDSDERQTHKCFVGIGRVTHDEAYVHLSGYFLERCGTGIDAQYKHTRLSTIKPATV